MLTKYNVEAGVGDMKRNKILTIMILAIMILSTILVAQTAVSQTAGQETEQDEEMVMGNQPPNIPQRPNGETNGKPNRIYTYTTVTTDPDGDQIYYQWDWGEVGGSYSNWKGPYNSGEIASASHIYNDWGGYSIFVRAKDHPDGMMSDWSEGLVVSMPKPKFSLSGMSEVLDLANQLLYQELQELEMSGQSQSQSQSQQSS